LLVILAIQKDISKIKMAGFVVLACVAVFMLLFFIHCMISDPDPEPEADHLDTSLTWRFFSALPTFITVYTFQTSFFTAFTALKSKTKRNGQLADGGGRIVAFFTYTTSPLIAMGLYGKNIKSNLLLNIAKDTGALPVILMFLFMIISALTIPIIFFVGKEAILIIFDEITRGTYSGRYLKKKKAALQVEPDQQAQVAAQSEGDEDMSQRTPRDPDASNMPSNQPATSSLDLVVENKSEEKAEEFVPNPKEYLTMRPIYLYAVILTLWFIIVVLSIVVGDVSVFFGIIGSVSANFCMFFGPGSFYVIIHHKKKLGFPTTWSKIKYGIAWAYLITGLTLAVSLCMCVIVYAVHH
jgi:amino acid permease